MSRMMPIDDDGAGIVQDCRTASLATDEWKATFDERCHRHPSEAVTYRSRLTERLGHPLQWDLPS